MPDHPEKRTVKVCIIGAGPAGLLLARLLEQCGIASVVLERRSREHVEKRVRAGLLEWSTVEAFRAAGVAHRLDRHGMVHDGMELRHDGAAFRLAFSELTGVPMVVYGQQEIVKDLIGARLESQGEIHFGVTDVRICQVGVDGSLVQCTLDGIPVEISCEFLAGCDGHHGVSRAAIPAQRRSSHQWTYPFAWLGVLAQAPPLSPELIYAVTDRGFALQSMRSPDVSRLYLQVPPDEPIHLRSDEEIWHELDLRLTGGTGKLPTGTITERVLVGLRAHVEEHMQYRTLFLLGDAAHIVPPSAAKGLNMAVADARLLAEGLDHWYRSGRRDLLDGYQSHSLRRAWHGQEFSEFMTSLLHVSPGESAAQRRMRRARLDLLRRSSTAATAFAEQYVGLSRP
ncbi:4-hydroxybenzoate 3-monooxygenase [Frankia sp. R43]|nr:4-hydroxybenzoate 3-monooxygenase [Frankia sp. R43]